MRVADSKTDRKLSSQERTELVRTRFDAAAATYSQFAAIQKTIAAELARNIIASTNSRSIADGLELGCGTGFLTEHLLGLDSQARWLVTDLSANMVAQCRAQCEAKSDHRDISFQVMDGQAIETDRRFDLIASNLTFQWFDKFEESISKLYHLLKPNGVLVFNLLGNGSFEPWNKVAAEDTNAPLPPKFRTIDELESGLREALKNAPIGKVEICHQSFGQTHPNLRDFFSCLKKIGANTHLGPKPSNFARLKDWASTSNSDSVLMNYEVFTVIVEKQS